MRKIFADSRGAAFVTALAMAMLVVGCATEDKARTDMRVDAVYDTAQEIRAMPACEAMVVDTGPCFARLTSNDGNGFYLGSPGSEEGIFQFVGHLKLGRSYKFPAAFLEYQKRLGIER